MPQNTPMKRQFTTIDGRTVMSNLPQHWGGNDWKITGVDNPLPVGNYVQTQAGVWIPQKGSDDGAADVRLTGSRVEHSRFDFDEVPPNQIITQTIAPQEGMWRIISLGFNISGDSFMLNISVGGNPTVLSERLFQLRPTSNRLLVEANVIMSGVFDSSMGIQKEKANEVYHSRINGQLISANTPLTLRLQNQNSETSITTARVFILREVLK